MIFVTVGTQLCFDRMVSLVDSWAEGKDDQIVAQVGPTDKLYKNIDQKKFLTPQEFDGYFGAADLVVAHAGMGSILTALSYGKPIIIMPRRADLGEHRNDHQMATAERFSSQSGVWVAWSENDLNSQLDRWAADNFSGGSKISEYASPSFVEGLKALIGAP